MTHLEKLAKAHEVENFFDHIIASQMNGNFEQVRELAKKLKRNELVALCAWCYAASDCGDPYGREVVKTLMR